MRQLEIGNSAENNTTRKLPKCENSSIFMTVSRETWWKEKDIHETQIQFKSN